MIRNFQLKMEENIWNYYILKSIFILSINKSKVKYLISCHLHPPSQSTKSRI